MKIYRVLLHPNLWDNDEEVEIFYPIGCSKTYTGFFTTSIEDAKNILNFLNESYLLDTAFQEDKYPSIIIETEMKNVVIEEEFEHLKTYNNPRFDQNELFVKEVKNLTKLKLLLWSGQQIGCKF